MNNQTAPYIIVTFTQKLPFNVQNDWVTFSILVKLDEGFAIVHYMASDNDW